MPEYANPVDPPDLGLLPTFRRLLRLWRREWRLGVLGLTFAFAYTLISITIPILTQRAIDHAIVKHTQALWPYLLAILGLATLRMVINFTRRFARRVSPLSRQVQERKGDVTEAADEAVVGIEMVQAFGREDDVRGRFGDRAEAVRSTVLRQAGVEARHLPGLYYLPSLSIAAVVYFGGRQVIGGHLSIGQFVLFQTLLLQLVWPLEALGWITN